MSGNEYVGRRLVSRVTAAGTLELGLREETTGAPAAGEVIVAMGAAPINPSDLGVLLGTADPAGLVRTEAGVAGPLPEGSLDALAGRIDRDLPVGIEGAGVVVAAGAGGEHLLGHTVAVFFGATYATHVRAKADNVLDLGEGTPPRVGASAFVNPLTALGMVETMRQAGQNALVHTAAASNLGAMLGRVCRADGIALVEIVRSPAQVAAKREAGARRVLDSTDPGFADALEEAVAETGARMAFDAIGGGTMAGDILNAMERAQARSGGAYSRYGSPEEKRVYLYGGLDTGPTILARKHGMAWSVGGWLLPHFLDAAGPDVRARLHARVKAELTTTFASHYTGSLTLDELMDPPTLRKVARKATGEKYLIEGF